MVELVVENAIKTLDECPECQSLIVLSGEDIAPLGFFQNAIVAKCTSCGWCEVRKIITPVEADVID
ncbi:MAG: hypothetical protein COX90_01830 [Candidatus Nealsonbacteria bacterium CG_4_10_14_0_2_um_filter_38_17]|uniref:Uncharacterized protein n=2 Tax=Candidatus Nealsoniibacteriota TaxID=1817911 RepID=A0A2M7UYA1_9BACT|nr:MAG: hypothetical protein COX36_04450 [Candidatus Nealsonbacteria bacterium CG23_combo_of_CG06-09_8_20_14_all_38_19]PIZ88961.1 MAG: hypothetical protein COX90_01830 [Candidatus Nealsonbacteria bacterium CG_4_10_14_0_2_um_filter_38_17]